LSQNAHICKLIAYDRAVPQRVAAQLDLCRDTLRAARETGDVERADPAGF
jgi:hypothetical protein